VQVAHPAATHSPPLLVAAKGQNLWPPSLAQLAWFASTHVPAVLGAAVLPVQSLQSLEQAIAPLQKFWPPSAAQVSAAGVYVHVAASSVRPPQSAQLDTHSPALAPLAPAGQNLLPPSLAQLVSFATTHVP